MGWLCAKIWGDLWSEFLAQSERPRFGLGPPFGGLIRGFTDPKRGLVMFPDPGSGVFWWSTVWAGFVPKVREIWGRNSTQGQINSFWG